VAQGKRIF